MAKVDETRTAAKFNGLAITGFVFGILSVFAGRGLSIVGWLAIIFSIIGLYKIKGTTDRGRGLAIAGLILGIIYGLFLPIAWNYAFPV